MKRITVYPLESAMHGAIEIWTKRYGYICFKLPTYVWGRWWPWYFYVSPNATPWGATLIVGPAYTASEKRMATIRRVLWGHGYDTENRNPQDIDHYTRSILGELQMNPNPVDQWTNAELARWMAERDDGLSPRPYPDSIDAAVAWIERRGFMWSRYSGTDAQSWVFVCPHHTCYESPDCPTARALCIASIKAQMDVEAKR